MTGECSGRCGAEPMRDRWGRPLINGVPYTRISTIAKALSDQSNLIEWQSRMMLRYASRADAIDVLEAVRLANGDTTAEKLAYAKAKERAGLDQAANRGTNLHAAVALMIRGERMPPLDDNMRRSLTALDRELSKRDMVPILSEQFVIQHKNALAGTFDLAIESPDGVFIADIKTGASKWDQSRPHAVAIQLAAYVDGHRWCPKHDYLPPHGADRAVAYLISLPVDTDECHIDPIDLDAGRLGLELALEVRKWRARANLMMA